MALQVWLQLNKNNLKNVGLTNVSATGSNITFVNGGLYGNCCSFNGSNSQVNTGYLNGLNCNNKSVSIWVKPNGENESKIIFRTTGTSPGRFYFGIKNATWNLAFGAKSWGYTSNAQVIDGQWQHIVVTVENNIGKVYFNGIFSHTVSGTSFNFPSNLILSPSSYMFNGLMTNLKIYDHCITEEDVKRLYQQKLFELVPYSGAKDVLFDRSGFMNMPLVNNGAIFQNNALYFNGSAKLRPKNGNVGLTMDDGTLSVWFTIETASTTYQIIYIDSVSKFAIGYVKGSNAFITTCNGTGSKTCFKATDVKFDGSINNVIVSYNTGKTPQFLLVNGAQAVTTTADVWTESSGLTIGSKMYNTAQSGFKGKLLKVGVYNRQFTQDEAIELYNSERGMFLPDEYEELEYIQSNGTQWIDTGINPKIKPRVVAKMAIINATDCDYWGNEKINGSAYYADFSSYKLKYYRYGSTTAQNVNYAVGANEIHVWDVSDKVYVDGSLKFTSTNTYTYSSSQATIQIFKAARASYYSSYKLYNFKLYDGDELCRNFVPAKRKSDSVIGLYDMVSRQFFTNSGTGSFTGA